MIERIKQKRNSEEGFTLVELLVVIVILGILAAIVVFAVGGIQNNASDSAKKTDLSVLQSAQEAYYAQNGVYTSMSKLQADKFLRSVSTLKDVCLSNTGLAGTAPNQTSSDYKIVDHAAADPCGSGWTRAN